MARATKVKSKGTIAPFPDGIKPMLALLYRDTVQNNPQYTYEVKLDGYRILAYVNDGKVSLRSRNNQDYTAKYRHVTDALKLSNHNMVLDGEVVVLDEKGFPDFDALQVYREGDRIAYYIFDILWIDGYSLMELSLTERQEQLRKAVPFNNVVRLSAQFDDGEGLFNLMVERGMEGIIAKRKDSRYKPDARTDAWLKMKSQIKQEYVIGGYTESDNHPFRALLFGYYKGNDFYYLGHSGGGYKDAERKTILQKLKKIEIKTSSFKNFKDIEAEGKIHHVKPILIADFKFDTLTTRGKVRKPAIFIGFRDDKDAKEVQYEAPEVSTTSRTHKKAELKGSMEKEQQPASEQTEKKVKTKKEKSTGGHADQSSKSPWPELEKIKPTSEGIVDVDGKEVLLTNVKHHIWPDFTKADLIQYYQSISSVLLPYLKDRPLTLYLKPRGIHQPGLFIKDMEGRQPNWAHTYKYKRKVPEIGKRDVMDFLVCQDLATLVYAINLGCIEMNPWSSTTHSPDYLDYLPLDLDPTLKDENDPDYTKVLEAAVAAKEFCDRHKLKAFVKTSGKTGIHFFIPCHGFTHPQCRTILTAICDEIHQLVPEATTRETSKAKRADKVYLDPSQTDPTDTIAAVYCARAWAHRTVSTPLLWKEVNLKLNPMEFTMDTIHRRLIKHGDLFEGLLDMRTRALNSTVLSHFL